MTFLIPVITGLTSLGKKYIPSKYHALIPVAIGVIVSPLASGLPFVSATITELIWAGLLAGMSAGGFYSVQNIRKK
jgi:hypothetical protein